MEEEQKKREEQLKIQQEIWKKEDEERRMRKEQEEKQRIEEENKKREEYEKIRKQREEERIKREKEERIRYEKELERLKREEEEEERKIKEKKEKIKKLEAKLRAEFLKKIDKKEEDLTKEELEKLLHYIDIQKKIEEYEAIKFRKYSYNYEGKEIKYTFEEIKQISTDKIINLEVTKSGKIVAITYKKDSKFSTITIYKEKTYEVERTENLKDLVNSFKIYENSIYCALEKETDNILIISLDNFDDKIYLNGHSCEVSDLVLTSSKYLISADIEGNIKIWKDNEFQKSINDFHKRINTITEINERQQRIAILSFNEEKVKFYDLKFSFLKPLSTIDNIKGSGFQNNMVKLNDNLLAISGTYMYIVDTTSFTVINSIYCFYANDCISAPLSLIGNKGYFFVGQAMTNKFDDYLEKGTIGYYEYEFIDDSDPDENPLIKIASKNLCHNSYITCLKSIDEDSLVTGSYDGKIKFWKIKDI